MPTTTLVLLAVLAVPPAPDIDRGGCPPALTVEQKVASVPGWAAFESEEHHPFANVVLSEGEPSGKVILAPASTTRRKKSLTSVWRFTPSERGYWLSCAYAGTSRLLSRRLPEGVTTCSVEYDANFAVPVATRVTCR